MKKIEMLFPKNKFLKIIIVLCITILCVVGIKIVSQQMQYQSYLTQAKASEEKEQYIDAVVYYAMASRIKPKKEKPYLRMADCYIERSEFNQANEILKIGMLNAKEQSELSSKQDEIRSFVNTDINGEKTPEYTSTENLKGKEKVKALIKKMRTYNGINGALNQQSAYYKGYFYFIEANTIYKTKNNIEAKEKIYRLNGDYTIERLKISNDRIFFCYYKDSYRLASIKIDGSDYIEYKDCMFDLFTIYKGWIYYHDNINHLNHYEDKFKGNIGISKVDFSGKKSELVSSYKQDRSYGYINDKFIYYNINTNKLVKVNLSSSKKQEESLVDLSKSKGKTVISNVWAYKDIVLYSTERTEGGFIGYYLYDRKKQETTKLDISENSYIYNILDSWIYYSVDTGNDENYKEELYRKNITSGEREKLKEVQCNTIIDISNDKVIIQDENEKGKSEIRFLDVENTEIN